MENNKLEFDIEEIGGRKYIKIDCWEHHRRGKNYIAEITDKHPKFKFKRSFLDVETIDKEKYYDVSNFKVNKVYDFLFAYYSGSGNEDAHLKAYALLKKVEVDKMIFEKMSEKDILNHLAKEKGKVKIKQKEFELNDPVDRDSLIDYLQNEFEFTDGETTATIRWRYNE